MNDVAHDLKSFVVDTNAIENLREVMITTFPTIKMYGVTVSQMDIDEKMTEYGRSFNHGRPRKVSLKRPSPQLSRRKLETFRALAILESTMRQNE